MNCRLLALRLKKNYLRNRQQSLVLLFKRKSPRRPNSLASVRFSLSRSLLMNITSPRKNSRIHSLPPHTKKFSSKTRKGSKVPGKNLIINKPPKLPNPTIMSSILISCIRKNPNLKSGSMGQHSNPRPKL